MPKKISTEWQDQLRRLLTAPIRKAGFAKTAKKIGVSDPALHRWIGGHNSIGTAKLHCLADVFGYRVVQKIEKIPNYSIDR
jgi:hypothetical protein